MVKFLVLIFSLFCFPLCADVKVSAEINKDSYEDEPLKGTITITHDKTQPIDKDSFLLGKSTLAVEFVKDVQIDPLILSIYNFTLPAKREGLYALQNISVKIDGTVYQSPMSSYTVLPKRESIPSPTQPAPQAVPSGPHQSVTAVKPTLRLEATIEGSNSLYPGQRTKLVYRYFFTGDIGLTTETLPLLDAEGFIKIGEKEINDFVQGNISIREITQLVEATVPGKYTLGPSLIEGRAYKEDIPGQPVFTSGKLSSEAPAVVITVLPFPEKDKPASFNGAVGQFTFKTSLLSAPEMAVGDEISLGLIISGKGNLKNITVSDLCCQPGMSGFFRLSDLPPSESIEGDTKTIVAKLRPLNTQIKAIPSIEFSFFNPATSKYVVLHSDPIPISVKAGPSQTEEEPEKAVKSRLKQDVKTMAVPSLIQIESIVPLRSSDLYNRPFGSWWALMFIPFAILLMIYQNHLKDYLEWKKNQKTIVTSDELFQQAFADQKNGKCDFELLKKSFKLALAEANLIPSADVSDKELPEEGLSKEVKVFCAALDEKQFAGSGRYDVGEIRRLSEELMNKIDTAAKPKDQGAPL